MAERRQHLKRYNIVGTTKTYRQSVLHRSGTQCACPADLFRFRGTSSFRPRIPLTVGVWPMLVAIVKPETQGVESCQVYYVSTVLRVHSFHVMPRGQRTFMGITARTSKEQCWYLCTKQGKPQGLD